MASDSSLAADSPRVHNEEANDERPPQTFHQFSLLNEDLQVYILSFVAQVPFEEPHQRSLLSHTLFYVSHQFYAMCQSDIIWQEALERLIRRDPALWVPGLLKLYPNTDSALPNFVQNVHKGLDEPGFLRLFQQVVERHLRFTGPVFIMSGVVRLGEGLALHFFEPRYRLLIRRVLEGFPQAASREGTVIEEPNEHGEFPTFIYAHTAPFAPTTPACLVRVQRCTIYANGSADVMLIPTAYVWLERLWEAPNTDRLHYAQCLRMPGEHARQFEEQSFQRPLPQGFENPLIAALLQDRGLIRGDAPVGLEGPLRAMLNYLVDDHGDDFDEDEGVGIPAD